MTQERRRYVWREPWGDESYRCAELAQAKVEEGGWYSGRSWLTKKAIKAAEKRWWARSDRDAIKEDDAPHHIPFQCGGCKFFAALGADWGICWCVDSARDGSIVWEHGGCRQHSEASRIEEMA